MTIARAEREELRRAIRGRAKIAYKMIEVRAAEVIAEGAKQIATIYRIDDARWHHLTAPMIAAERKVQAALAAEFKAAGIPKAFQPTLSVSWSGRGENAFKTRRAELQHVLETAVDANVQAARLQVAVAEQNGIELLTREALESDEANAFLAAMPTVEAMIPAIDVQALPVPTRQLGYRFGYDDD